MQGNKYRVLIVSSHPVQYAAPLYRLMAQHPKLDILVAYCSLQGAEKGVDPGFGVEVAWDVPLLEGYPWVHVPNRSPRPGIDRFFGLINPELWKLVRQGGFDCLIAYGYAYLSFWIAMIAAKLSAIPIVMLTDQTTIKPRLDRGHWKKFLKPVILPIIYRIPDIVGACSAAGVNFVESLGLKRERIVLIPFVVDNDYWTSQSRQVNREVSRSQLNIPVDASVVLFCAKLQPWKRPQDVLRAFAKAEVPNAYLVFAGEGPMRKDLEAEACTLGVADRVRFLGFVNQSRLPSVYRAADLFVLPSEHDPCPVVVCEAMLCGCPVVLSDEIRGRFDIVHPGETGFIYPCGNIDALAAILREVLPDHERLKRMSEAARKRMETWSYRECLNGYVEAIEKAVQRRKR